MSWRGSATRAARGTIQRRRDELVEAGALRGYDNGHRNGQGRLPVPQEEIERRVAACERAIRELDAEGEKISYPTVVTQFGPFGTKSWHGV